MAKSDSVLLSGGQVATLEVDRWNPARTELVVDGTPQSSVNLGDPTDLAFEYVERIGHAIDLIGDPGEPITAVHFGAGALTIPRYVAWTRPGSRQQVVELEPALVDLVRERLPLPKGASIRVRYGDAREVAEKLPAGLQGAADLVVVDVFAGATIPAPVTTVEFYRLAAGLLNARGILAVNVADGAGLPFARTQMATVAAVLPHVAVLAEAQTMKGRRFGNLVLVGTRDAALLDWLPRLVAAGPHPAQAVSGDDLTSLIRGAAVVTDATASPSPDPGRGIFSR
ncbi:spermidine synthase [Amnibacterium setariae]|uniref:Spermine synthase n=1 Tax=Amnibacterium setariae TaxID=2306585 RepID=A0A3A1U004_9MICO|nr:spermine synthase [Amnibacterium setariae]